MADYFGFVSIPSDGTRTFNPYAMATKNIACPGTSGTRTIVELSMYCYSGGGTPGHARIAIYKSSDDTLVCQGSAEILVSSTSPGWDNCKHTTFTDSVGDAIASPELTVGQNYWLFMSTDSSDVLTAYDNGSSGDTYYTTGDLTNGFPASGSGLRGSEWAQVFGLRCGLYVAPSGLSIPLVQSIYRRRRI